jgi:Cu(I)/Ag(I) efflux system membrane fusion protein
MTLNKKILLIAVTLIAAIAVGTLILRKPHRHEDGHLAQPAKKTQYQCSMHPPIVSDEPGNCPICHMTLTPVIEESDVPGHAAFTLSGERQQLIGVKTTRVERRPLTLAIRAAGKVAYDPDLYNALAEYREALAARQKLSDDADSEFRENVDALVQSSALKLRLMGISDKQANTMLEEDADSIDLLLPGKTVWIYAQVYENEANHVRPGQTVTVTVPSSRRTHKGTITTVDPILDPVTRTVRVRVRIETPPENLKPETFVQVAIQVPLGEALAVPEDAVLDTGDHKIVFVKEGDGRFEPRAVELGREAQEFLEVISGLKEGEDIVTSANFLIDSESRFKAAVAAFQENKNAGHTH